MKPSQISVLLLSFLLVMCANAFGADSGVLLAQNDQRNDSLRSRMEDRRDDSSSKDRSHSRGSTKSTIDQSSGLTQCQGEYALCLASVCKPTGRKIKVKRDDGKSFRFFEESECKCPVITAEIAQQNGTTLTATAGVNEGNMNGSCAHKPGTVWALYNKDIVLYPQESASPPFAMKSQNIQQCPQGTVGSNCWNFECKVDKEKTNGAKTATCFCAINDGQFGREVRPDDSLFTAAGGYYNPSSKACGMYPANGWIPPTP